VSGVHPECPVGAIFSDSEVPAKWQHYIDINAERSAALKESGGHITERQQPRKAPAASRRRSESS
jgi:hypothetical protein